MDEGPAGGRLTADYAKRQSEHGELVIVKAVNAAHGAEDPFQQPLHVHKRMASHLKPPAASSVPDHACKSANAA